MTQRADAAPASLRGVAADAWEASGIVYWRGVVALLEKHKDDPLVSYGALDRKPGYELIPVLTPFLEGAVRKAMLAEARHRMRITLLQLVEERQKHKGRWPVSRAGLPGGREAREHQDLFTG